MTRQWEVLSVLVALEFVVMTSVLLLLGPLDAVVGLIPLFLVFLFALYKYRF